MSVANCSANNTKNCGSVFDLISSKSSKKHYRCLFDYLINNASELEQDQSFYIFDLADILWKTQLWHEKFPNVFPYYAVKANADPVLARLFVLLGYGFDCSTEGEIRFVLKFGADPRKIIFAHTIKSHKALKFAASVGVDLMTFDTKEELHKISKDYPTARLVLRIKSKSAQHVYNLSKKFGCDVSEAEDLLLQAKALNLNVVGVSFHVGALCDDPDVYTSTIDNSRLVFDVAQQLGYKFTIMDIGAGFFGSEEREEFFYKLSGHINSSLENNFPKGDVKFIAEPGCYCVASAASLVTSILGKKNVSNAGESSIQREYFLNDGFYQSFFEHHNIYDVKPVPVLTPQELEQRAKYKSRVWGQTCCSEDIISDECLLPDMEDGEFIQWLNMGAYGKGCASRFTIVPSSADRYIFVQNPRLRLDSIPNQKEVTDYISEVADLVESNGMQNGHFQDLKKRF